MTGPYRADDGAAARAAGTAAVILAAVLLAPLWPLLLAALGALAAAWLLGLHPVRVARAAAWSAPVTVVYLGAAWLQDRTWQAAMLRPYEDWKHADLRLVHGPVLPALLPAVLATAPVAIPAGLAAGAGLWAWRTHAYTHGLAGTTGLAPSVFDRRQWHRQARTARRAAKAPGLVPMLTPRGVPAGPVIRVIRRRWTRILVIPLADFTRHQVIIGASGSGKTTLMIRLWAGWFAAALRAHRQHAAPPPLLAALDCKGGPDARAKAAQAAAALKAAGARNVAIWPDHAALSIWTLPPRDLAILLHQLIEHGEGSAQYYADMMQAIVFIAVLAPCGPPGSTAGFLARLDAGWMEQAYAEHNPAVLSAIRAAKSHIGDIRMRYATLLSRLGPALDRPGTLDDADAWYFILEGTAEASVAETQAMALTELIARAATSRDAGRRAILLAADDYSAVSRRVPLSNLYERGRSLGLGVMVSAQSWHGLGADEDERYRIAATADGGIWLMRTPHPEPIVALAGTRRLLEAARKLLGGRTGDEGTARLQYTWVADPDIIRQLDTGQACYIQRGTAAYIQAVPARTSPARPGRRPAGPPAIRPGPRPAPAPR